MNIGDTVKKMRETEKMTQKELAIKAKISQASLHYIENGVNSPSLTTLQKLANALGVKITDLLEDQAS